MTCSPIERRPSAAVAPQPGDAGQDRRPDRDPRDRRGLVRRHAETEAVAITAPRPAAATTRASRHVMARTGTRRPRRSGSLPATTDRARPSPEASGCGPSRSTCRRRCSSRPIQQQLASEHLPRVRHQERKQVELQRREGQSRPPAGHTGAPPDSMPSVGHTSVAHDRRPRRSRRQHRLAPAASAPRGENGLLT